MLRKDIEKKFGEKWWERNYKMDINHTISLCVRRIDEKIPTILQCGVIYKSPDNPKRYICVHKESSGEYISSVFIPTKYSNIVITGFPAKPEHIEMFEKITGGG